MGKTFRQWELVNLQCSSELVWLQKFRRIEQTILICKEKKRSLQKNGYTSSLFHHLKHKPRYEESQRMHEEETTTQSKVKEILPMHLKMPSFTSQYIPENIVITFSVHLIHVNRITLPIQCLFQLYLHPFTFVPRLIYRSSLTRLSLFIVACYIDL